MKAGFRRRGTAGAEQGAALVEMVVVLPLLIVLALGVAEASWAFAQQQAVRSVAREGARVAASHPGDTPSLVAEVCDVDDIIGNATFEATGEPVPYDRGARGYFEVTVPYKPLTGFISAFNGRTIVERVYFNAEMEIEELLLINGVPYPEWWSPGGGGAMC